MRIFRDYLGGKKKKRYRDRLLYTIFFSRAPVIQTNTLNTALFVFLTLIVSMVSYGRFVYLVIKDITEFVGIACLTVKMKDEYGNWVHLRKSSS